MLPEPPLPDAALATRLSYRAQFLALGNRLREMRFDQAPARREVGVSGWQRPHRVEMVRQHDDRIDMERVTRACPPRSFTQRIDFVDEEAAPTIEQRDGEEPASSRDEGAAVVGHA
jgi:hypothetical protein